MKKLIALALVVVMVLGCISLVACNGGDGGGVTVPPAGGTTTPAGGETTTPPPDETTTPPEETLEDILGYGAGITAVQYEMVITAPGVPEMTTNVWIEQDKMRTEMTEGEETVIMIADFGEQVLYMYMPDYGMAYEMAFTAPTESALEAAQSIPDYEYTILRTETLNGMECLVVEYASPEGTAQMWIWKDYGFPIKTVVTTPQGTITSEFRDIQFGDIEDEMFELPAGVTIISL
ncbi:MAG TPA: DUF4412 domain-containing protein [Dehalococcoidia bacterium]|nr:DUF4412 domain-containing protein [Dehalococcoidia bacterium]